jgi:hypothetical protein
MRAGLGTGWKCVQQNSFLLYDDSRVVQPSAAQVRPPSYVLRGRPPVSFEMAWSLTARNDATIWRLVQKCGGPLWGRWGLPGGAFLTRERETWQDGGTEKGGGPKVCESLLRTPEVVRR